MLNPGALLMLLLFGDLTAAESAAVGAPLPAGVRVLLLLLLLLLGSVVTTSSAARRRYRTGSVQFGAAANLTHSLAVDSL